ncbi:hypothetical protein [Mycobacterium intracellulare]|uniref:hypothetical protein n=1 Tax=Mycobacterium intracellulare TaxID=1767 RepID=UPI001EEEB5D0|nr:hypothetical protein [Mycobacterium intracellulare]MEE3755274.1 hypothetical protein [Mycobacterium intracellulare]
MEAYLYSQHLGDTPLLLTEALIDISDLASRGVLDQNSSVWISAHSPKPDMWMLTERSSYAYIHQARTPGYVRVNKSGIRWAPDWDSTLGNAALTLAAKEITVSDEDDVNITLIVKHRVQGQSVTIIKPDGTKGKLTGGCYTFGGFTVIDLLSYESRPLREADSYERNHANHMGAHHILRSVPKSKRRELSRYIDAMRFPISDQELAALQDVHLQMRSISANFVSNLRARFSERGAPDDLLSGGQVVTDE